MGLIDGIIPEGPEGAQVDAEAAALFLRETLHKALSELSGFTPEQLVVDRYDKYRKMGNFFNELAP